MFSKNRIHCFIFDLLVSPRRKLHLLNVSIFWGEMTIHRLSYMYVEYLTIILFLSPNNFFLFKLIEGLLILQPKWEGERVKGSHHLKGKLSYPWIPSLPVHSVTMKSLVKLKCKCKLSSISYFSSNIVLNNIHQLPCFS